MILRCSTIVTVFQRGLTTRPAGRARATIGLCRSITSTIARASYETDHVTEKEDEHPNRGGLVYVYYTNHTDATVRLNHWRWNDHDESIWRLDGVISWDRASHKTLAPGQTGVLEIIAPGDDFAPRKPYALRLGKPRHLAARCPSRRRVAAGCDLDSTGSLSS